MTTRPSVELRVFAMNLERVVRCRPSGWEVITVVVMPGQPTAILSSAHPATAAAALADASAMATRALGGKDGCG